jgi:hypothetical protein
VSDISKWDLPVLQNLMIESSFPNISLLSNFFATYLPNLVSLDLCCRTVSAAAPEMARFLGLCAALEELTVRSIVHGVLSMNTFGLIRQPSLRRLNIQAGFEPIPDRNISVNVRSWWDVNWLHPMLDFYLSSIEGWIGTVCFWGTSSQVFLTHFRILDLDSGYFHNIRWREADLQRWESMSRNLSSFGVTLQFSSGEPIVITDDIRGRVRGDEEWRILRAEADAVGASESESEDLDYGRSEEESYGEEHSSEEEASDDEEGPSSNSEEASSNDGSIQIWDEAIHGGNGGWRRVD